MTTKLASLNAHIEACALCGDDALCSVGVAIRTGGKVAAIGTDGTRNVVWGLGDTEDLALEDAAEQEFVPADLTTRTVTAADVVAIEAGDVDAASLGRAS